MILQAELELVKSRIIQIIGDRIPLGKHGQSWKALCPFHQEKTPSFSVSERKNCFTCFSCGASGDVIDFLRKFHGIGFKEAVAMLGVQGGKPSHQDTQWQRAKKAVEVRKIELKATWNQDAAGLRYIRHLIRDNEPLEREADWFTAELLLDKKLDQLEAELRE